MANGTAKKIKRESLYRQTIILEGKIERLDNESRRFSWIRLAIVILGGLSVWGASSFLEGNWGLVTLFLFVILFSIVVWRHRILEKWKGMFQLWLLLKKESLSRMDLDWSTIPPARNYTNDDGNSLAIDLDLTGSKSLHQLIDTSVSYEGSQLLAEWITSGEAIPEKISERQQLVRELSKLGHFRSRLRLAFMSSKSDLLSSKNLFDWESKPYPSSMLRNLLIIVACLLFINTTLFILNIFNLIPSYWIITTSVYFAFYLLNSSHIADYLEAIVKMDGELDKFLVILRYLERYPLYSAPNLARLCDPLRDPNNLPSRQLKRVKLVSAAIGMRMNPFVGILLNLVFPWDYTFAILAKRYLTEVSQSLRLWNKLWIKLEALISLATFAELNPDYVFPEIVSDGSPIFEAKDLGHPLIPLSQKKCNDFQINRLGELFIITGSNMAGKSTFLKTVGINLCLAYAGGPVNARLLKSWPFRLHTCIRISDSLSDGYSYFYAEVKCLKSLLARLISKEEIPLLYIVDEIYRGTNNWERLAGSKAFIKSILGKKGVGLLATHDLELASQFKDESLAKNYHFRDSVQEGKLVFDYSIRPGISPTTNALVIMQMEGLPTEPIVSS